MLSLGDYFSPLTAVNLIFYVISILFFDILGTKVTNLLKINDQEAQNRIVNWLIGLGIFMFSLFVVRFFVPPSGAVITIMALIFGAYCFPTYIKKKEYKNFFKSLWNLKLPIIIILPFLPAVFVKASLPPYYGDEMAYHFLSPSGLARLTTWHFTGGLYDNLPKNMDTLYTSVFAVFKTYSIARLLHFSVLATAFVFAYGVLRRLFSPFVGAFFVFAFFSIPDFIVLTSTLGYVDVATYSFMLVGMLYLLLFLLNKERKWILFSGIFWSLALGTKYTPLTAVVALAGSVALWCWRDRSKYFSKFNKRLILELVLALVIFGGYWYVKNLVIYGNPTYPFLFPCARYASEWCGASSNFFGSWTTKITAANFWPILRSMFPKNIVLQIGVLLSVPIAIFGIKKKVSFLTRIIFFSIALEFVIFKFFSGFYVRYHQHIQLWLLLILTIGLSTGFKDKLLNNLKKLFYFVVFGSLIFTYIHTVKDTNSLKFLNWTEINYSIGKINIYDWVEQKFPYMSDSILWCDGRKEMTPLARFDPDLIWFDYSGYMRSFLTNCYYQNPPLQGVALENVLSAAKEKQMSFWIASPNKCVPENEVVKKHDYEDDNMLYLRELNNLVVCNSRRVAKNLYSFNLTE